VGGGGGGGVSNCVTGLKSAFDEASLHLQLLNTVGFVIFLTDKNLKRLLLDEPGGGGRTSKTKYLQT